MLKETRYKILKNLPIADSVLKMELEGDSSAFTAPGQFANVAVEGFYLRRPISVCDWNDGHLTLIYKVVGQGTEKMASLPVGSALSALTGLGNGFDPAKCGRRPLLVGGGVGVPPLYGLAKRLTESGKAPLAVLGFGSSKDVFYKEEFERLGIDTLVCTVDGSLSLIHI